MAMVLRAATYLTACSADADDLAQETMLKAFKALDRLDAASSVKAWLLTILRHAHVDRLRARGRQETSLEQLEIDPADPASTQSEEDHDVWTDPEAILNRLSDQTIIHALRELPKEIRWTLLLSDIEGLEEDDTAAILDVPAGTIKSRLYRGRRMLRQVLAPLVRELRITSTEPPESPSPTPQSPKTTFFLGGLA